MPWIIHRLSPLDREAKPVFVKTYKSLRATLEERWPEFTEFQTPTVVSVNGIPVLRKDWDKKISRTAMVECWGVPAGVAETLAIISIVVTVASLLTTAYLIATMPKPVVPAGVADIPPAAPVFTFAGQQNIRRLNQIIEKAYGRNRWWPAYLAAPYVEYSENKAIMRVWLSLGYGTFAVEDVKINDTSMDGIPGSYWEYRDAGFTITADDPYDVVVYSKDLVNTEMRGTNEIDYAILGPYVLAQESYVTSSRININVSFPSGLYGLSGSSLVDATGTYTVQIQAIDADDEPVGALISQTFSHTAKSSTPQRFTDIVEVPSARYRVTLFRTNNKNTTTSGQDRMVVESVIGLARSMKTYPVSAIRVELLGSDTIGSDAASQINVIATAKVPVLLKIPELDLPFGFSTSGGYVWSEPVATRNPIWAFMDVFRAQYGANVSNDHFDLDYILALATEFTNETFDFYFNNKSTVWEVARVIAATIRAQPFIVGSDIRLAVDRPTNRPVAMFNPDNANDLTWSVSFKQELEEDCIDCAFVDPVTGLQDIVRFTPPGSLGVNPKKMSFDGVTSRDRAWQLGAYTWLSLTLRRQRVSFKTGYEGFVPLFGDLISVQWTLPNWGIGGSVMDYDPTTLVMTLSEPCDTDGAPAWLALRKMNGSVYGPIQVTQGANLYELVLAAPLTQYFDFSGESGTPVMFTFGTGTSIAKDIMVTQTTPNENGFSVEGILYNPAVFSYDSLPAPDRGQDMIPYPNAFGAVPWIQVFEEDGQYLRVQWGAPFGEVTTAVYFAYDPLPATALTQQTPFGWMFAMTPETDVFGTVAYIPRQVGDLYIKVTTDNGVSFGENTWRAYVGAFNAGTSRPFAATLVNNVDTTYVDPLDPGNASGALAQAVEKAPSGTARWDIGTKELTVMVQGINGTPVTIEVRSERLGLSASVFGTIPSGSGTYTFTADVLYAANMNLEAVATTVGTGYNPTTIRVTGAGITTPLVIALDIEPLSNGSAGTVEARYQTRHGPNMAGLQSRVPGIGPTGAARNYGGPLMVFSCELTGVKGYQAVRWREGLGIPGGIATYVEGGSSHKQITVCSPVVLIQSEYGSENRFTMICHNTGSVIAPGPSGFLGTINMAVYWNNKNGVKSFTEVFPGRIFRTNADGSGIYIPGAPNPFYMTRWLECNALGGDINTYTKAEADQFYSFFAANKDLIMFLPVEYQVPTATFLDEANATTVDVFHKQGWGALTNLVMP